MKTRHVYTTSYQFKDAIDCALKEVKSFQDSVRVVNCGRGVVILPDTDRSKDCTDGELIKALGIVKKYNGLRVNDMDSGEQSKRSNVMIRFSDCEPKWVSLTPDQMRLLNWLRRQEYIYDEVEIQEMAPQNFEEI